MTGQGDNDGDQVSSPGRGLLAVVSNDGWCSAGDLGDAGDWPVSGWERTTEDPDQLERARPQRDRRKRERSEEDRLFFRRCPR